MKQNILDIAKRVATLSPHERSQFFHAVCRDNPALADAIREQLEMTDWEPATQTMIGDQDWFPDYTEDLIGKKVGCYFIEKHLGEGGMGFVFLGLQEEPIRRKVAIKLIKPSITCQLSPRRFLAERQALAMMNHHNIAKIFDAGMTQEGLPYFAMEYIDGSNITQYCQDHQLSIEQRISLFIQLCDAIQHASQNGILHRDLKPSNILVAATEDGPVVKVIDFGIAKSIKTSLTDETLQTELGRVVGTLPYMSPEQLNPDTQDIDTRSDVYTLGVLLQELLSGVRPFNLKELEKRDFFAVQKHVLHGDPIKPSVRIAAQEPETLETLAQNRGLSVTEFKKFLCGDLDWIILKAQAKSREERYVSAHNLKVELRRFLNNQPVLAGPPNLTYRLKKFARRHRLAVAFSSMLLLTIIGAFFGVSYGLLKASKANIKSQATIELLKEFLISPTPSHEGSDLKVATLLENFEPKLQEIQDQDVRIDLLHTVAKTYVGLGQSAKATSYFQTALESLDDTQKSDHLWIARIKNSLNRIKARQEPSQQTRGELLVFWETSRQWLGSHHDETQAAEFNHAYINQIMGQFDLAYQLSKDLLAKNIQSYGKLDKRTLSTMMVLGYSLLILERTDESIEIHEEILTHAKKIHDENSSFVLITKSNLSNAYHRKSLFKKAWHLRQEIYQQALKTFGEKHPNTLAFRELLAFSQSGLGYFEDALALIKMNHDINSEIHGPTHFNTMLSKSAVAIALFNLEDYGQAFSLESEAYEFFQKELGAQSEQTLISREMQAANLACQGHLTKAITMQKEIVKIRSDVFGEESIYTIHSKSHLAAMQAVENPQSALPLFDLQFAKFEEILSQMASLEDLFRLLENSGSQKHLGPYYAKYLQILERTETLTSPLGQDFLRAYHQFALNYEPDRAIELKARFPIN